MTPRRSALAPSDNTLKAFNTSSSWTKARLMNSTSLVGFNLIVEDDALVGTNYNHLRTIELHYGLPDPLVLTPIFDGSVSPAFLPMCGRFEALGCKLSLCRVCFFGPVNGPMSNPLTLFLAAVQIQKVDHNTVIDNRDNL
jgi:hypothetical protein